MVLLTVMGVALSYVYESVYRDYAASKDRADINHKFQKECSGFSAVEELRNCLKQQIEASTNTRHTEEDLYAQKQMAQWAFWMLVVTGITGAMTFGITAVGIYFVRETLEANKAAVKAANAAVSVASKTAERQLRAYVHISSINYIATDVYAPHSRIASIEIRNYGQTPARDLTVWFDIDFRPYPLDGELTRSLESISTPKCVLAPGATTSFFVSVGYPIISSRMFDVRAGNMGIYLFGEITYVDAFCDDQTTTFRMIYSGPDAIRTGHFANYDDGNKAT